MVVIQIDLNVALFDAGHIDFDFISITPFNNIEARTRERCTIRQAGWSVKHGSIGERVKHFVDEGVGVAAY
jgi:hypothetical protein